MAERQPDERSKDISHSLPIDFTQIRSASRLRFLAPSSFSDLDMGDGEGKGVELRVLDQSEAAFPGSSNPAQKEW